MITAFLTAIVGGPSRVYELVHHIVQVNLIELLHVARARAVLRI